MSRSSKLPSLSLSDVEWDDTPPDPVAEPGYYDGLIWRRVFGYFVDIVIVGSVNLSIWIFGILTLGLLWPVLALAVAILPIAYHTYFIGRNGATPGMSMMDVEIRCWNGNRVDFFQAFLQTALFYTTVPLTSGLVLLVGLFNSRSRTLHDILAGTVAIRRGFARVQSPAS